MDLIRILLIDDDPIELELFLNSLRERFFEKNINIEITIRINALEALDHLRLTNPYDIVLVDIVGVDYESVLNGIKLLYPYLPIIMFSRQRIPEQIVKCIDLGARSFIFKQDLRIGARPIAPYDEYEDEQAWERILNIIQKLIDEYKHIKRILESSDEIGLIRKTGDKNSVIKDQISFLQYIKDKPEIAEMFPVIHSIGENNEETYYEMPLYRMRSLRHLIFEESNQESCIQISIKVLDKVLEFVFNVLYKESINKDVYSNFVQKTYFEKFSLRLDQLHELILSQKAKENHFLYEIFQKLLESDTILINNERLLNPSIILQGLQQDATFVKLLQPPFLTIIHGDLHFDNILVNDRLAKNIKLKLIDPRGFQYKGYPPGIGDIAYDIGKLLHSANGYYDFIHSGYMIANINSIKNKQDRSSEMASLLKENWATVLHKGGGSGDVLISHKQVVQQWSWYVFDILSQHIKTWIEENGYLQQDPYFWLRAKFNEAMHFCTMPKFHLQEDIVRTISIQIRGVELLNQFYKDYNKGLFTS